MSGSKWINEETHKKFLSSLELSKIAVWLAAQILEDEGHSPKVNHTTAAATHKERGKHLDKGDISILDDTVEVKWWSGDKYSFTCREEWKFPFILVCPLAQWHYHTTPVRWMYFNNKLTHYVQFNRDAVDPTNVKSIFDGRYKVRVQIIVAKNEDVLFLPVPPHILARYNFCKTNSI